MHPPLWMRCLRLYGQRFPIIRGKASLAKLAFRHFTLPEKPFDAGLGNGISLELYPWIWADFCTYVAGSPELYHLQYIRSRLRPDHIVFDIGAYIGVYTFTASEIVTAGHVYTFEPDPRSAQRIRRALHRGDVQNITLCQAAVGDTTQAEVTIILTSYPPQSTIKASEMTPQGEIVSVPVWSIDDYCGIAAVQTVDFMKIDVEGAELGVLHGAAETLQTHHPELLIELHAPLARQFGHTIHDVVMFLEDLGYTFAEITFGLMQPSLAPCDADSVVQKTEQRSRHIIIARHPL